MDKSREEFEAWWGGQGEPSEYITLRLAQRIAWHSWQVSRMRLVVELPEKVMVEDEYDRGHNYGIKYCEEAIRAAGITVKGDE